MRETPGIEVAVRTAQLVAHVGFGINLGVLEDLLTQFHQVTELIRRNGRFGRRLKIRCCG